MPFVCSCCRCSEDCQREREDCLLYVAVVVKTARERECLLYVAVVLVVKTAREGEKIAFCM